MTLEQPSGTPETQEQKPWYQRWWAITLWVVIGFVVLGGITGAWEEDTQADTAVATETSDSVTPASSGDSAESDSLLGYSPFDCPVWDAGKAYGMDELIGTTMSPPWCSDLGVVTTYCGVTGEDIATRFAEDGEITSGGSTTFDSSQSVSTYDTLLPGFPQAVFINAFDESYETLICPNGEALHITDEHSAIFTGVGKRTDLPPRSALVSPVAAPVSGSTVTSTTVGDEGSFENSVECPRDPTGYVESEQAARCLYDAWVSGNSELASRYASEEAIAWLGPQPDSPPGWQWHGCNLTEDAVLPVSCQWSADLVRPDGTVDEEMHGALIEMLLGGGASAGFWVESIESFG